MTTTIAARLPEQFASPWGPILAFAGLSASSLTARYPGLGRTIGDAFLILFVVALGYWVVKLASHRFVPRRFANLVYLLDDDGNLALVQHPRYRRFIPPGSRLGYHEPPDRAVARVLRDELGLDADAVDFWPPLPTKRTFRHVHLVPVPYQVQVERRSHRLGIREHYDFVYVCRAPGVKPRLDSPLAPRWVSPTELAELQSDDDHAPFEDVAPTYQRILAAVS